MGKISSWGLAQCLFWACVSGIGEQTDCDPVFLTTTVFATKTIYTSAPPNVTSSTKVPWVNSTTTASSSSRTTSSWVVPIGNTTISVSFPSTISSTSVPFGNSTSSATIPTTTISLTSVPLGNTTTSISIPSTSNSISSTTAPFGNTTTTVPTLPTSTTISSSSPPFGNTSTSATTVPSTSVPTSIDPTTTASATTSPTAKPTPPFGGFPPLPPGPFRGYKNGAYFTNWGINAGFHPQELPVSELTHIYYAFADIDADGTVKSSDPITDLQKRYPGDSLSNRTRNAYGAVKQLYIHKKWNRNLKVLLSIGGWNYSPKFVAAAATDASRHRFATSAVKLVTDWGFDGIDVDWEYPADDVDKENLVKLLQACRQAFDRYSLLHGVRYRFTISVASPASPLNYEKLELFAMNRYVDSWHLMAYDYSGSWDTVSGHQANVFSYESSTASKRLSTDDAVRHYESQGIHPQKILLGLPLYGRAFEGTSGLGQNYTSVGQGGPQPGVYYYKELPKPGAAVVYDDVAKATYSYDAAARELVSYDDVRSVTYKSQYLRGRRLGGAFFWEASGDRGGALGLVNTMSKNLDWLDETPNNLYYPTSQYQNIRRGMPRE
ncbi:glycoside hydrolase family 18 protein [Daldinia caldariorum]|uniref:glycoside hydrolase family 18 protein n=1 Tax=Daldinia caldariorum TaxID=326644 RepID=UPI002007B5B0|nr:glycoside hydrolase family 18 protein [Daldinia caldariorum]KAI1469946.1 glycoside hydrolase family 18 protein [Daldinia caldariorum]